MFIIKQYDTLPSLEATLIDAEGNPVDLTTKSVTFSMRSRDNPSLVITGLAVKVDAVNGIVAYQWGPGNTNTPGAYLGEFRVTYSNGPRETFPSDGYIEISVVKSAGNAP